MTRADSSDGGGSRNTVERSELSNRHPRPLLSDSELTAKIEPFDSFWEAPEEVETGYEKFSKFYEHNYLSRLPQTRDARILVISCGPGYFLNLLRARGYTNVFGIDSSSEKIAQAKKRGLDCEVGRAFQFLSERSSSLDVIIAEQEINHLTKEEILAFLDACRESLVSGGTLVVHSINGADPLTGSESRAGNFDHYNSFTEYSLAQVLGVKGFRDIEVFPLNLYVFYANPLNYLAILIDRMKWVLWRFNYGLVGKQARIYTKKIGAICHK